MERGDIRLILVNTPDIVGKEIKSHLGVVKGEIVQSRNVGRDLLAGLKTIVGGEISSYTEMIQQARQIATDRMIQEAEELGADAIVNIRFGSSSVLQGCAEMIVYGTAVKLK